MDKQIETLLEFMKVSSTLRKVWRYNWVVPGRQESSAEHSWHAALLCWLLHDRLEKEFKTDISLEKLLKMSIMHDLVEIEVGDASVWNKKDRDEKAALEENAAVAMFAKLPADLAQEFTALWHEFEKRETLEAKIVKAVESFDPSLLKIVSGQGWHDIGIDRAKLDAKKIPDVAFSKTLTVLYEAVRDEAVEKGLLEK